MRSRCIAPFAAEATSIKSGCVSNVSCIFVNKTMKKVVIIGCGGSGKSTLAVKLGEKLGLPVVHLDRLLWREGWSRVEPEEFDRLLADELKKESWIMDGNFKRTLPLRLAEADTVIFLDFSRLACLRGVLRRQIQYRGRTRPDMGDGCPEHVDFEFLTWILRFKRETRPKLLEILSAYPSVHKIVLKNRRQVKRFLKDL